MADKKEYIERDKVLEMSYSPSCATLDNPLAEIKSVVDYDDIVSIPAADVVEVRHGEWLEEKEYYADDYSECNVRKVYACSLCGRTEKRKEPYCNCGAKMDGKSDDNA